MVSCNSDLDTYVVELSQETDDVCVRERGSNLKDIVVMRLTWERVYHTQPDPALNQGN